MKDTVEILGVRVNLEDYNSAIEKVKGHIDGKSPTGYITLMSANNLINAQRDGFFKKISNRAFLALPDGISLVWLVRQKGAKKNKDQCPRGEFYANIF